MPAISFLVCTRNRADVVKQAVMHLLRSPRQDIEVVVRDNFSTDDTVQSLQLIDDSRLKIFVAPENQGTVSFFEISKLATGDIVTWLSDEDDFQHGELDSILERFRSSPDCNVMFGSIVVGPAAGRVIFPEERIEDPVRACILALCFSGCGGLFVRRTALAMANSMTVRDANDGYALWNYYPVGFFASRCMTGTLMSTSRIAVIQTRFARTTNNWSKVDSGAERTPHYYPESVFDRLASNLVNVYLKPLPTQVKLGVGYKLVRQFCSHALSFSNPAFHKLLRENYPTETVDAYLDRIRRLKLDSAVGRVLWAGGRLMALPAAFRKVLAHWRGLRAA